MLPKSERLNKDDFVNIYPKVFFRGEYFDVASKPSLQIKFACVTLKKRIKKATQRNKVKRRIFNAIQQTLIQKTMVNKEIPRHIIFYPKPLAKDTDYQTLYKEISKVFATLH